MFLKPAATGQGTSWHQVAAPKSIALPCRPLLPPARPLPLLDSSSHEATPDCRSVLRDPTGKQPCT